MSACCFVGACKNGREGFLTVAHVHIVMGPGDGRSIRRDLLELRRLAWAASRRPREADAGSDDCSASIISGRFRGLA